MYVILVIVGLTHLQDVREILGRDNAGQNVLRHLDKSKVLTKPYRKMLVHKLCAEIVQKYGNR